MQKRPEYISAITTATEEALSNRMAKNMFIDNNNKKKNYKKIMQQHAATAV